MDKKEIRDLILNHTNCDPETFDLNQKLKPVANANLREIVETARKYLLSKQISKLKAHDLDFNVYIKTSGQIIPLSEDLEIKKQELARLISEEQLTVLTMDLNCGQKRIHAPLAGYGNHTGPIESNLEPIGAIDQEAHIHDEVHHTKRNLKNILEFSIENNGDNLKYKHVLQKQSPLRAISRFLSWGDSKDNWRLGVKSLFADPREVAKNGSLTEKIIGNTVVRAGVGLYGLTLGIFKSTSEGISMVIDSKIGDIPGLRATSKIVGLTLKTAANIVFRIEDKAIEIILSFKKQTARTLNSEKES